MNTYRLQAQLSPTQQPICGRITLPGSKYSANRALCIAAFTPGRHIIHHVPCNDDIQATCAALRAFSIPITQQQNQTIIHGHKKWHPPSQAINCQDNGTLARFICALSARLHHPVTITGSAQLCQRPMGPLTQALRQLGATVSSDNLPLTIKGPITQHTANIDPQQSSQYLSALLLLEAAMQQPLHITATQPTSSKHYIGLTKHWLQQFQQKNEHNLYGDLVSAGYFLAGAMLTQGNIIINNFPPIEQEAERDFLTLLQRMGANIQFSHNHLSLHSSQAIIPLPPCNLQHLPDSIPTLSILQAFTNKKTIFQQIGHLQYKECNRLQQLAYMLQQLGYKAHHCSQNLYFHGGKILNNIILDPANDHRMAMAFALTGLRQNNILINNPHCVNKSLPEFWKLWENLGVQVRYDTA